MLVKIQSSAGWHDRELTILEVAVHLQPEGSHNWQDFLGHATFNIIVIAKVYDSFNMGQATE